LSRHGSQATQVAASRVSSAVSRRSESNEAVAELVIEVEQLAVRDLGLGFGQPGID
jgi:hypothetical protein